MDITRKYEEVRHIVESVGWKLVREQFEKKKETLKELTMELDLSNHDNIKKAIKYQAEYESIVRFPELVKEVLSNLHDEMEGDNA